ncbi:cysteine hydrolase family protein [Mucilaginibacter sp. FT3.2]|uniref:cysteine hydrolase family protein n=1 Tax=Mucilaginibacter sp. FT3.2 TaxID=2723090 RepID=UPI00160F13FB|nr:isochorismatase family cysteine hydrolase [Mucilaginibacter sp. FT3.2]MBB6234236.1 nicotinamidase-related amidase [Mucilaginibacter sp. FT3.2]
MTAFIIIDVQNEFSAKGKRPVPDHPLVIEVIRAKVEQARENETPIAWVKHYNLPTESVAFVPGTWGAEFVEGFGPLTSASNEKLFEKNVYGAFTGTDIGPWLASLSVDKVVIMGFYTHGCVSTTSREAIMKGLEVFLDPETTGTCAMEHPLLGTLSASENRRAALLQLENMGAVIVTRPVTI